jgi:hypothetical protein
MRRTHDHKVSDVCKTLMGFLSRALNSAMLEYIYSDEYKYKKQPHIFKRQLARKNKPVQFILAL